MNMDLELIGNPPVYESVKNLEDHEILNRLLSGRERGMSHIRRVLRFLSQSMPEAWAKAGGQSPSRSGVRGLEGDGRIGGLRNPYSINSRYILRFTSVLSPYLERKDITALLAPCDEDARHLYHWLRTAGVKLPENMSMLSFDNYPELQLLPISSVDFGFGGLGYQAFHTIMGVLPVLGTRGRDIPARPIIIHRGSVVPASKSPGA